MNDKVMMKFICIQEMNTFFPVKLIEISLNKNTQTVIIFAFPQKISDNHVVSCPNYNNNLQNMSPIPENHHHQK